MKMKIKEFKHKVLRLIEQFENENETTVVDVNIETTMRTVNINGLKPVITSRKITVLCE